MMRRDGLLSLRGAANAIVLALVALLLGWLCFRAAMVRTLPATSPTLERFAPGHADAVLERASLALIDRHGILDASTLADVRRAATVEPLDARAFLILGQQQIIDHQPARAVKSLEAGERLDPRNRLIHLLLLERYLNTGQFTAAATQFSVLARLVGDTQPTIATAMAQMTTVPKMRTAVRRTLRDDPNLEQLVLVTLAKGNATPRDIFSLASPTAMAAAGEKGSWGPALIARLVAGERYDAAHAVWQRVYRLSDAAVAALVFNGAFQPSAASPPFDWTLTASSLGAADLRDGALAIDYYGRDSGELASQLLVLAPGRYQFSFVVDAGKMDASSNLAWTLACATGDKAVLATVAVASVAAARRIGATFAVPSRCPAQTLVLRGEAGEFPVPANLAIRDLAIRAAPGAKS